MTFFDVADDEGEIFDPELVSYWAEKSAICEANRKAGKASGAKRKASDQGETQ
jgi:hypothetical protein